MRRRLRWAAALCALAACSRYVTSDPGRATMASAPRPRVSVSTERDEYTGATTHRLDVWFNSNERMTVLGYGGDGVSVLVHSFNETWEYLECHSTVGLADDTRIVPRGVEHDGDAMHGGVLEHVTFTLASDDVRIMAHARQIRFRICNTEYELPRGSAAAFAEFYRRTYGTQPQPGGGLDAILDDVASGELEPPE